MSNIIRVSTIASVFVAASVMQAAFAADAKPCPYGQANVPKWSCVSVKEIAKAKRNCMKLKPPTKDFTQCLCQDGSQIGACGD